MPRINLKRLEIIRTGGPNPYNRYGVVLTHMPRVIRRFMISNRHIREWSDDDQFLRCIFAMQQPGIRNARDRRFYYDAEMDKVTTMQEIQEYHDHIDWYCAVSKRPIRARFMNFDLANFVHSEYYDVLKAPMVDSRILKSSIEFRKKCKELLLEERREFMKVAKKNSQAN